MSDEVDEMSAASRGSHRETKDMSIAVGLAWAEYERRKAAAEIERLRLTDEEREAIRWFAEYGDLQSEARRAEVLAALLKRLG